MRSTMLFSIIAGTLALCKLQNSYAFMATQQLGWMVSSKCSTDGRILPSPIRLYARQPSRVTDDFGPAPDVIDPEMEEVTLPFSTVAVLYCNSLVPEFD